MTIKRIIKQFLVLLFFQINLSLAYAHISDTMSVLVNSQSSGKAIPGDFIGLSYETKTLLPDEHGKYYFNAGNKSLISVFKSLGIKSLRIGGNSVDVSTVPIPTEKDIDHLFAFARAAGVKVIYSVRLHDGDVQSAANLAKHIYDRYATLLDYFAVGNEPGYYKDYENQLKPRWQAIVQTMQRVAPGARFCAPDDNPNPDLCQKLLNDFSAPKGPLSIITFHSYPGDCAYKNPFKAETVNDLIPYDAKEKRELLLSAKITAEYEKIYNKMAPVIARFPFRLSETNNIWYGGLDGASNSYASALWALDYMYWWAGRGATGVNFHTGDKVGGGAKTVVSRYAAFVMEGSGFDIRPLSYAIKAFSLGFGGEIIPVSTENSKNLAIYATKKDDGTFFITAINKSNGKEATTNSLFISFAGNKQVKGKAEYILLQAPDGDIAIQKGITLGEKGIAPDGTWKDGVWKKLNTDKGIVNVEVPSASAVVIKVKL